MMPDESLDSMSRPNPLLMPIRLLLYWLVKGLVLLFLGARHILRPKAVRYTLLVLLVGCSVGWKAAGEPSILPWSQPQVEREAVSTTIADSLPQPEVVERYFKSQAEYDAAGLWETMNDTFKKRMTAANNSLEQLQKELEIAEQQQRRYGEVDYVGGMPLTGGKSVYFYVLNVEAPTGASRLPYTFIVDAEGKIANIQWSLER